MILFNILSNDASFDAKDETSVILSINCRISGRSNLFNIKNSSSIISLPINTRKRSKCLFFICGLRNAKITGIAALNTTIRSFNDGIISLGGKAFSSI